MRQCLVASALEPDQNLLLHHILRPFAAALHNIVPCRPSQLLKRLGKHTRILKQKTFITRDDDNDDPMMTHYLESVLGTRPVLVLITNDQPHRHRRSCSGGGPDNHGVALAIAQRAFLDTAIVGTDGREQRTAF